MATAVNRLSTGSGDQPNLKRPLSSFSSCYSRTYPFQLRAEHLPLLPLLLLLLATVFPSSSAIGSHIPPVSSTFSLPGPCWRRYRKGPGGQRLGNVHDRRVNGQVSRERVNRTAPGEEQFSLGSICIVIEAPLGFSHVLIEHRSAINLFARSEVFEN